MLSQVYVESCLFSLSGLVLVSWASFSRQLVARWRQDEARSPLEPPRSTKHCKTQGKRSILETCESIEREARLNGNCWIRNLHCLSLSVSFNPFLFLSVSVLMILSLPASVSPLLCLSIVLCLSISACLCLSSFVSICLWMSLFNSAWLCLSV